MDRCLLIFALINQVHQTLMSRFAIAVAFYPLYFGLDHFVWGRIQSSLKIIILVFLSVGNVFGLILKLDNASNASLIRLFLIACPQICVFWRYFLAPGGLYLFGFVFDSTYSVGLFASIPHITNDNDDFSDKEVHNYAELFDFMLHAALKLFLVFTVPRATAIWTYFAHRFSSRQLYLFVFFIQALAWGYLSSVHLQRYHRLLYTIAVQLICSRIDDISTAQVVAAHFLYTFRFYLSLRGLHVLDHTHRPLDTPKSEIRLLKLLPAQFGAPVRTELIHIPISEASRYDAVSYRWSGTPNILCAIYIDGQAEEVTFNVHALLRHLRDTRQERLLWIDSICINQADDEEKSWQIGLMNQIFSQSVTVIGWLGSRSWESRALRTLGTVLSEVGIVDATSISIWGWYSTKWHEVINLLMDEWFSRIWIIQEVSLAKTVVLQCGHETLSWDKFSEFLVHFMSSEIKSGILNTLSMQIPDMATFEKRAHHGMQMIGTRNQLKTSNSLLLHQALLQSMGFESTKPQDRIYGILGLSTKTARKELPISYSLSETDIFVKVARYIYLSEAAIDELLLAGTGHYASQLPKTSNDRRPTWVPDWTSLVYTKPFEMRLREQECCSYIEPKFFKIGEEERTLGVSAAIIDTIDRLSSIWHQTELIPQVPRHVSGTMPWNIENNHRLRFLRAMGNSLDALYDEALTIANMTKVSSNSTDGHKKLLWRIILASETWGAEMNEAAFNKIQDDFDSLEDFATREAMNDVHEWAKFQQTAARCFQSLMPILERRLGLTENGVLGIVPPQTQPGDIVCVIAGSKAPFILRPTSGLFRSGSKSTAPVFELIGPCFMDGIMKGELKGQQLDFKSIILE